MLILVCDPSQPSLKKTSFPAPAKHKFRYPNAILSGTATTHGRQATTCTAFVQQNNKMTEVGPEKNTTRFLGVLCLAMASARRPGENTSDPMTKRGGVRSPGAVK